MKKIIIILLAIIGWSSSVKALVCVEGNCNTMGYTTPATEDIADCKAYIYCPYDISFKTCARYNAYPLTETERLEGGIYEQSSKWKVKECNGTPLKCPSNACEFTMCNDGTYDYSGRCSEGFEKYTSIGGNSNMMRDDLHCALCSCAKSACKTDSTAGSTSYAELENGGYVHLSCESSSTTDANGCLFCCPAGYAKAQKYMGTSKASTLVGQVPEYDYSYVDRGCVSTVCSFDWQLIAAPLGALAGYIFPDDKLAIINQCAPNYTEILDDNGCITRCELFIASLCRYKTV